jgi:hypothetical protein
MGVGWMQRRAKVKPTSSLYPAHRVRCESIVSRAAEPAKLGMARDLRLLGVALRRIIIRQGTRFRVIEADDARLTHGFHVFEDSNGFRWTNGNAALPLKVLPNSSDLLSWSCRSGAQPNMQRRPRRQPCDPPLK